MTQSKISFLRILFVLPCVAYAGGYTAQGATPLTAKADRVLVLKQRHVLQLLRFGRVLKEYKVALGGSPVGPKSQQGDHKTPEGLYTLDSRNAKSQYYKSLHISYPRSEQRAAARKRGVSPRWRCFRTRLAQPLSQGWSRAPALRLDRRLHRRHQRGNGRDLANGRGWNAHRNSPVDADLIYSIPPV